MVLSVTLILALYLYNKLNKILALFKCFFCLMLLKSFNILLQITWLCLHTTKKSNCHVIAAYTGFLKKYLDLFSLRVFFFFSSFFIIVSLLGSLLLHHSNLNKIFYLTVEVCYIFSNQIIFIYNRVKLIVLSVRLISAFHL